MCKHEYKSEVSSYAASGLIWVCSKCGQVRPYKRRATYFETLIKKYGRV